MATATDFLGGGIAPPEMYCTPTPPPEAFGTAHKSFCAPENYIYYQRLAQKNVCHPFP